MHRLCPMVWVSIGTTRPALISAQGRGFRPRRRSSELQPLNCDSADTPRLSPNLIRAEVVRLALFGRSLPTVGDTVRWGDVTRRAAMSRYGRLNGRRVSPALSGKDAAGRPLRGHRHTFYLPTDDDGDGCLDHLTLATPAGLDAAELASVASIDGLNPGGGQPSVRASVAAIGAAADFRDAAPILGVSSRWRSLTPYILPRHTRFRGPRDANGLRQMVDGPEDQVVREVATRWPDGPGLIRVHRIDPGEPILPMRAGGGEGLPPFAFSRQRGSGSNGGGAFNFILEWPEPVLGPIALGFGCHYGLGLFVPA